MSGEKRIGIPKFKPLNTGRIHLLCPKCGMVRSNMPRQDYDHPKALWMETQCYRHDGYDDPSYYDANGKELLDDPETFREASQ